MPLPKVKLTVAKLTVLQVRKTTVHSFDNFPRRYNVKQFIYFWKTSLHISGGISTHHQEHINCIYSIWYLSNRYCYLPLLWNNWNCFECGVGIVLICFGAVATAPKPMYIYIYIYVKRNSFKPEAPLTLILPRSRTGTR